MATSPQSSTLTTGKKPDKAFSCVRCFDRKVKCTKQIPCTACTKAGVECVFRQPAPPRRRKKRTHEELLLVRLQRCEELLKSHGLSPDSPQSQETDAPQDTDGAAFETGLGAKAPSPQVSSVEIESAPSKGPAGAELTDHGRLVSEHGRTKFFENNLYSTLNEELHANDDLLQDSSGDESLITSPDATTFANGPQSIDFMMGISPTNVPLVSLHPPPEQIYKLWQVYLDNVNPLTKIVHQPTLQSAIFEASFNLDKVGRGLEALMFAIYASATFSLTDKECSDMLHDDKTNLLGRYRLGVRKALLKANFLATSDITVLQALTIYLSSMRTFYEVRTMWILAGVASRLGQSLGLHRDGSKLGLSAFDTEMRRRLWWQITMLDGRSAELSGSARTFEIYRWDLKVPANVDDADLYPQMADAPVSAEGKATEMISCCLRYEVGEFLRQHHVQSSRNFDGEWQLLTFAATTAEKDKVIEELETRLEEKFLRYCNPSVSIHFHAMIVAYSCIQTMRLMAHHPRHRTDKHREQSDEELAMVFSNALKIIEYDNICHSSQVFQRFLWHTHSYFQWQSLIYLLSALRTRTEGPEVDTAWQQIEETYEHHPAFLTDTKRPLHVATGGLCLKAWQAREAALARSGMAAFPPTTPAFIQTLRQQRSRKVAPAPLGRVAGDTLFAGAGQSAIGDTFPAYANTDRNTNMVFGLNGVFDINAFADFSMEDVSPMNWDEWDNLVHGYETSQLNGWTGLPGLTS